MTAFKTLAALLLLATCSTAISAESDRYYLFIGDPSPAAWKLLMDDPEMADREKAGRETLAKLGGELLAYFWGANNAKNYILVRLPADSETVPASLIMRLSTGLLTDYEAIELFPSDHMPKVLERISDIMAVDEMQSNGEISE